MRGSKKLIILEITRLSLLSMAEVVDAITYYGYVETYRRMRGLSSLKEKKNVLRELALALKSGEQAEKENRANIYQLTSKLKREGLIKVSKNKLQLTRKGEHKRREFETTLERYPAYPAQEAGETIIVCFDIPESIKSHRAWLRAALRNLKMDMHQKSLWIGRTSLPEKFIEDMNKRGIVKYVDIFSVSRGGTLKKMARS